MFNVLPLHIVTCLSLVLWKEHFFLLKEGKILSVCIYRVCYGVLSNLYMGGPFHTLDKCYLDDKNVGMFYERSSDDW